MSSCRLPVTAPNYDGDMWIIYMGNNEMVGPFGAGTIFGDKAPNRGFVKAMLRIRSTRLGQLLVNLTEAFKWAIRHARILGRHRDVHEEQTQGLMPHHG